MAQDMTHTLTIHGLTRLRNSRDGNPRYRVTFTDGTVAETEDNAHLGHVIENSEYRGVPLAVTFTPKGKIAKAEPVT